jgi:hypothetical protein
MLATGIGPLFANFTASGLRARVVEIPLSSGLLAR